ncbi:MAG: Hsp20/alpha crystallin family protein [Deltaproteobacteria bacterium]|nr:Hsp20/alpha crystallin family protein [Deltaproteobacteria bacterium]
MSSSKWDPFKDLMALKDRMNRLFDMSLSRELELATGAGAGTWAPTCDVMETEEGLLIQAELPGLSEGDYEVLLDGGEVVIRGDRKLHKSKPKQGAIFRLDGRYGTFRRAFTLPDWADEAQENIKANYSDGVLEVKIGRAKNRDSD